MPAAGETKRGYRGRGRLGRQGRAGGQGRTSSAKRAGMIRRQTRA